MPDKKNTQEEEGKKVVKKKDTIVSSLKSLHAQGESKNINSEKADDKLSKINVKSILTTFNKPSKCRGVYILIHLERTDGKFFADSISIMKGFINAGFNKNKIPHAVALRGSKVAELLVKRS